MSTVARVPACCPRCHSLISEPTLQVADLELNWVDHAVTRSGKQISLTPREMDVLYFMMRNKGRILTRTSIVASAWGKTYDGLTNVVDVNINYLRQKIDQGFGKKLIHTVRGIGYKIEG
jgi:DNA-binding response OmpR family regulator